MSEDEIEIDPAEDAGNDAETAQVSSAQENDTAPIAEDETKAAAPADSIAKASAPRRYHAPLYIAACIFLAAIIFFCAKLCFFNTDLYGTWGFSVKTLDGSNDMVFNLSFEENTVRMQSGGTVYIGRLTTKEEDGSYMTDENGKPIIMLNMNLSSKPFVYKFNYEFEGNVFTGRKLKLTDLSGMFYEPDLKTNDSDEVKARKKNTGYIETDEKIYYVWTLSPSTENALPSKPKSFKADDKLVGTWLYKTEETAFPYTWTFYKDGMFEQNSHELELHGTYSVNNGTVSINWSGIGGNEQNVELKYKVENKKLTLSQGYEGTTIMERELTKTNDKFDFKDGTD